jgi:hypothetical protein
MGSIRYLPGTPIHPRTRIHPVRLWTAIADEYGLPLYQYNQV